MGVRTPPPSTPFFECAESFDSVVIERNDGARAEIGDRVIRTPERCRHWTGDGDIRARRTGYDEVLFTKEDVPVDVVVTAEEIVLREPGRVCERHDW